MDTYFETIGNATLTAYDNGKPIITTDPWIKGDAYFKSWKLSHKIPQQQMEGIQKVKYIWLSHGHPDHISIKSLNLLRNKKIFLADHYGKRIYDNLKSLGFKPIVLLNRKWYSLSKSIKICTISDYNQDSIILIAINDCLIVNLNDASDRGWGNYIKRLIKQFKISFILKLSGYGDADMLNVYNEAGSRIIDLENYKVPFGAKISKYVESYKATYFLPFSSMHQYQRKDSIWANKIITNVNDHEIGYNSEKSKILPAFIKYDCRKYEIEKINPEESKSSILYPDKINDSWDKPLDQEDKFRITKYFNSIEHIKRDLKAIIVKIGGAEHIIDLDSNSDKVIMFESPRNSFMDAINYQIFDDILIGNFMKTTLIGKDWHSGILYPDFTPYVSKYSDNGGAKNENELKTYFMHYRKMVIRDYLLAPFEIISNNYLLRLFLPSNYYAKDIEVAQKKLLKVRYFYNKLFK